MTDMDNGHIIFPEMFQYLSGFACRCLSPFLFKITAGKIVVLDVYNE